MTHFFISRDLFTRLFIITVTALVVMVATENNQFDLHFKIRKTQPTSRQLVVLELPENAPLEPILEKLLAKGVQFILIRNSLYRKKSKKIIPFSIETPVSDALDFGLQRDNDGILRRTRIFNDSSFLKSKEVSNSFLTINYRGPRHTFPTVLLSDISEMETKGKVILIKSKTPDKTLTTPIGLMDETEIIANIVDNHLENRFIPDGLLSVQIVILLMVLLITTSFILYLPSTLALVTTFVFAIFYISLSLWFFDNLYFWTPIITPNIVVVLTFLLISNYKFILNEKTKWNLEKESKFINEVEEMKTNFLSFFSHDLKTPLAKIIGLTETLKSKIKDTEILDDLEKITDSSQNLEKDIKRILKISQIQLKDISLRKSPVDLNALIEKSIEQNEFLANKKKIRLLKDLKPLFMIDMDGPLVKEVIMNFIENAIKYSPEKSEIRITSMELNNSIKVSVIDQGQGITEQDQKHLGEKYHRFDSKQPGYGLGLFLSRYVIHLHGGEIFLNSQKNVGSEFGFIMPIREEKS